MKKLEKFKMPLLKELSLSSRDFSESDSDSKESRGDQLNRHLVGLNYTIIQLRVQVGRPRRGTRNNPISARIYSERLPKSGLGYERDLPAENGPLIRFSPRDPNLRLVTVWGGVFINSRWPLMK